MPRGRARVAVVIEDDADVRVLLESSLVDAGFVCHATGAGLEGIELVRELEPILTTLDIGLPGIDGFEVTRRIRVFSSTYIMILSARTEEIDTLMALDAGADDYLTKPFRVRELRGRIEAMLRRYEIPPEHHSRAGHDQRGLTDEGGSEQLSAVAEQTSPADLGWLTHNGLRVNPAMQLCEVDGQPVDLTRSEFVLLVAIMLGARRVISKHSLALDVRGDAGTGGYVSESDERVVESHLAHLRRKIHDPVNSPRFIETVRGVGYRLTAPQEQNGS